MDIQVLPVGFQEIKVLRESFRSEAQCQIVADSALPRGLADSHLILVDGDICGYGGIWNTHYPGRLTEFYVLPKERFLTPQLFSIFLKTTKLTHIAAQTNMPFMLTLLYDWAEKIVDEKVLFGDFSVSDLSCPKAVFRQRRPEDDLFTKTPPVGEFVLDFESEVVASGGYLTHYNPPYADLFMEVKAGSEQQGFGSYLIQELKKVCYEAGLIPAARCDIDNVASRRTLEKAGMAPIGRLLVGECKRL